MGKGKVFLVQAIRNICTAEVQLHSLTSGLDAGEWLSSHPSHCIPRKEHQYQLNTMLGGLQSWSAHFGEGKNLSSILGFKLKLSSQQHAHHTHHTTRTPI